MTLEVKTFGCRLNSYESELIKKAATEAGMVDTIIFNSCAVTAEAERQLRQSIRSTKKKSPNIKIIVTGCAVQINPQKYAGMPEVDGVIGNTEKTKSDSYMSTEKVLVNDIMSVQETASHFVVDKLEGKARAFLQVQNGCNHRCTYCIIPYGRGNSRSVAFGDIVKQAQILVDNGYSELVLTGVDITDYGLDLPGQPNLGQIVKRLLKQVPDLKRLRLSSIDVAEIDSHLIDVIASEPRFMPHLHISLQAGDDLILKRMKRRHSRKQVIDFCHDMRKIRPGIAFGADIIAGFPTESDEMFQNSMSMIEEAGLVYLHIFPYSERDSTPAARMPQVPNPVRKVRAAMLRKKGQDMLSAHYKAQIGKQVKIIMESPGYGRAEDFSAVKLSSSLAAEHRSIFDAKVIACDADHLIVDA